MSGNEMGPSEYFRDERLGMTGTIWEHRQCAHCRVCSEIRDFRHELGMRMRIGNTSEYAELLRKRHSHLGLSGNEAVGNDDLAGNEAVGNEDLGMIAW